MQTISTAQKQDRRQFSMNALDEGYTPSADVVHWVRHMMVTAEAPEMMSPLPFLNTGRYDSLNSRISANVIGELAIHLFGAGTDEFISAKQANTFARRATRAAEKNVLFRGGLNQVASLILDDIASWEARS